MATAIGILLICSVSAAERETTSRWEGRRFLPRRRDLIGKKDCEFAQKKAKFASLKRMQGMKKTSLRLYSRVCRKTICLLNSANDISILNYITRLVSFLLAGPSNLGRNGPENSVYVTIVQCPLRFLSTGRGTDGTTLHYVTQQP